MSEINLSSLRSQLTFFCADLQNLTVTDIKELKWTTKKLVLTSLISQSPLFEHQNEELALLNSERGNEIRRLASADRSARFGAENIFRNQFMQIIVSCLTELKWPPAIEAFANPLPFLMSDKDINYSAINYLLNFGVVPYKNISFKASYPKKLSPTSKNTKPAWNLSETSPSNISNNNNNNSSSISKPTDANFLIDTFSSVLSFKDIDGSHSNSSISIPKSARSSGNRPDSANSNSYNIDKGSYTSPENNFKCSCNSKCPIALSFEILHQQNQSLSKQIKHIQEAVVSRETAELNIQILIKELLSTIKEVADISNDSIDKSREHEMAEQTKKTDMNISNTSKQKPIVSVQKFNSKKSVDTNQSSLNIWKSLYGKISDLKKKWEESRSQAKKAAFSSIDIHRASIDLFSRKSVSSNDFLIFDGTSRVLSHKIFGVNKPLCENKGSIYEDHTAESQKLALDLSRVYQLQHDLIEYYQTVSNFLDTFDQQIVFSEPSQARLLSKSALDEISSMKLKGMNLILHLSALAPLAPLSSSETENSSVFGLENLLSELYQNNNKKFTPKLQRILERVLSEHKTLARSYQHAVNMLSKK